MSTQLPIDEVIVFLLDTSGCRDREDLLAFACTIYDVPGASGSTKHMAEHAEHQIEQGIVPDILARWYMLVRPERPAVMAAA